jgi:hypothetical protein
MNQRLFQARTPVARGQGQARLPYAQAVQPQQDPQEGAAEGETPSSTSA